MVSAPGLWTLLQLPLLLGSIVNLSFYRDRRAPRKRVTRELVTRELDNTVRQAQQEGYKIYEAAIRHQKEIYFSYPPYDIAWKEGRRLFRINSNGPFSSRFSNVVVLEKGEEFIYLLLDSSPFQDLGVEALCLWEEFKWHLMLVIFTCFPVVNYLLEVRSDSLVQVLFEYVVFVLLLSLQYAASSSFRVSSLGRLAQSKWKNVVILLAGSLLSSLVGTMGASMLLIRSLILANKENSSAVSTASYLSFIWLVGNVGGLLTPLGDPPLFLGFLQGMPVWWPTVRLWKHWLFVVTLVLIAFILFEWYHSRDQKVTTPAVRNDVESPTSEPVTTTATTPTKNSSWMPEMSSRRYLLIFLGIILVNLSVGLLAKYCGITPYYQKGTLAIAFLLLFIAWSIMRHNEPVQEEIHWDPLAEVVILYFGIFLAMAPAIQYLEVFAAGSPHSFSAAGYYWLSGATSSVLDNAPTFITFAGLAAGQMNHDMNITSITSTNLTTLVATPQGGLLLEAIAAGSVMMGALTYLGNAPNLMIRGVVNSADTSVKLPGYLMYSFISLLCLAPVFAIDTIFFAFRGL